MDKNMVFNIVTILAFFIFMVGISMEVMDKSQGFGGVERYKFAYWYYIQGGQEVVLNEMFDPAQSLLYHNDVDFYGIPENNAFVVNNRGGIEKLRVITAQRLYYEQKASG